MSDKFFLDTNIVVYSFNKNEPDKQAKAIELMDEALKENTGCISFQVIQEFLNVALKKFTTPLNYKDCQEYLHTALEPLCEVQSSTQLYFQALDIADRWRYSFYDSLIISSAIQADCKILYTEDLQHDQYIKELRIVNPFL